MESLEFMVRLLASMETRPSRFGTREDGFVCSAKPGECRYNTKYYGALGLNDQKAWQLHQSDENCDVKCPNLINQENKMKRDCL